MTLATDNIQNIQDNMSQLHTILLFAVTVYKLTFPTHAADVYLVDNTNGTVRRFDGIGGLSGGGATSKLLVNYPKEQQDQILDYLFKPLYGASLQILKVEIGGDAQSTDGTEASHMHNSWDENYQRGYEWWMMKEAKKRNPDIRLYCLPWAFPAWIGNGTRSPYTNPERTADYVVRFILGAKKYHNLTMNYVGIWNERAYNSKYIKVLRNMLNSRGLQDVQIVAADGLWEPISEALVLDDELAKAVDIIGVHYPGTKGSEIAFQTGKQLWSSEDYSTFNDEVGGGCWARILNQNYVNGNMTSTLAWNAVASYYESLPFARTGLMTADSPWSGHYKVDTPIWMTGCVRHIDKQCGSKPYGSVGNLVIWIYTVCNVHREGHTTHTTNFVWPGWYYFPHGSGVSLLKKGGSMVAYYSFDDTQISIVVETMSHNHSKCIRPALPEYTVEPQNVTFNLNGKFISPPLALPEYTVEPQKVTFNLNGNFSFVFKVDVWYSKLEFDGKPSTLMKKLGTIPVINGTIHLSLGVDEVYTLTTLQLDKLGDYPPIPADKPFPLPYQDDFESYTENEEPFNLAQQVGVYEVIKTSTDHGQVIQQTVLEYPCAWCQADIVNNSVNMVGNPKWYDWNFEIQSYPVSQEPFNFAPQVGVFEVVTSEDPGHGQVMSQVVLHNPIFWCLFVDLVFPIGVIGDFWSDIYIESDTHIGAVNATSGVFVAARVNHGGCDSFRAEGIYFFLFPEKGYIEITGDLARTQKLFEKNVTVVSHAWNKLGLLLKDGYMSGTLNGQLVFNSSLPERTPAKGFVALGTAEYGLAEFDNLKIMDSSDGERRIRKQKLINNYAYGPSFDIMPVLDDWRVYDKSNSAVDDTLYFRPLQHDDNIN